MSTHYIGRLCTVVVAGTLVVIGCDSGGRATSPAVRIQPLARAEAIANPTTRTHTEFDINREADFYLSCINEITHWVISGHITIDVLETPTGITSTIIRGRSNPSAFYVVRANGVRYDMIGQGSSQLHEFEGPVSFSNLAEPKVFRSASGDVLVTNYHLRITFDAEGNPTSVIANGACP